LEEQLSFFRQSKSATAPATKSVYVPKSQEGKTTKACNRLITRLARAFKTGNMSEDAIFNIFKYALYDDKSIESSDEAAFPYADEVVQEVLLNTGDKELAAEAVVVLNVWMMIAHKLYNVVCTCKEQGNAKVDVDEAVALWIGQEQSEGQYSGGWLLYSTAQRATMHFGLDEAEAAVNTELFLQFNDFQLLSERCFEDPAIHLQLRIRVDALLRSLSIPLL
jgi:hypothetical protein